MLNFTVRIFTMFVIIVKVWKKYLKEHLIGFRNQLRINLLTCTRRIFIVKRFFVKNKNENNVLTVFVDFRL